MFLTKDGHMQTKKPEQKKVVIDKTTDDPIYNVPKNKDASSKNLKNNVKKNNVPRNSVYIKKKEKHRILKGFIKTIFALILIIMLAAVAVGGYAAYKVYEVARSAKITRDELVIKNENSVIKDIKGNELGVLNGEENRVNITIDDMSEYLPKAFVAIEDERFYTHPGVDFPRTVKATMVYLINKGSSPFGGSTITQQLVKNLTNEKEDTWQRKVREMVKAYYVENELTKDEILEIYLNLIFLGDTVYGVEQGSNYYFNKSAKDLDLAESAFLAGINHSPNSYNPFIEDNEEVLKNIEERTEVVLTKMYELGEIDSQDYALAVKEAENGLHFEKGAEVQVLFSYHTDAAIKQIITELQEKNNWTYNQAQLYLFGGGFTIYTTQDPDMQAKMDEEFRDEKYHTADLDKYGNWEPAQASMVLIDHKTGHVLAISNGFEEKTTAFGFNIAIDAKKQTGSSMKTLAVLAPAIDKGIVTASTILDDSKTTFNNGTYEPQNYANTYRGLITVRDAIAYSQNIPMLKVMCLLTPEKSIEFLKSAGITSLDEQNDCVLPLALGGLTYGVTPLQMAGAYSAIANDGVYIKPTFYTKVVDKNGNAVLEADSEGTRIMSAEAAFVVKEVLTESVKKGTSTTCAIEGIDVGVKTGTTNDEYDRWLCGFTPYYTATVWFGHDKNVPVKGWSLNPASQIWTGVMKRVHEGYEPKTFYETKPEGVVEVRVCRKSGFLATSTCESYKTAYTEYFVSGTEPIRNMSMPFFIKSLYRKWTCCK